MSFSVDIPIHTSMLGKLFVFDSFDAFCFLVVCASFGHHEDHQVTVNIISANEIGIIWASPLAGKGDAVQGNWNNVPCRCCF